MLGNFWGGFEKRAFDGAIGPAGVIGGAISGYHSGRSAAGTTSNALSRHGYKTKNEETARNVAKVTGALGAVGGVALALKHKKKLLELARKHISNHEDMEHLYHAAVPFLGGTAGGAAAGVATGGLAALRGSLSKQGSILNVIPGMKNFRQGYRVIDKLQRGGWVMPSGAATSALAEGRKALAGKAMAHGAAKMIGTAAIAHHLLKKPKGQDGG